MTVLRSTLFNVWFFALTAVLSITGTLLLPFVPGLPLRLAQFWARLVLRSLSPLCAITWEVRGLEHLPTAGPALLASRHESAFDTLVWLTILPRCSYVTKRELLRIPLFGRIIRTAGQIAVDRAGGAGAVRDLMRQTAAAAAAGRQIVVFPEGTRAAPGQVLPLQPGVAAIAAATGLPVIPVVTDSGRHWGRRAFRKYPGTIHITLLPPLPPEPRGPGAHGRLIQRLEAVLARDPSTCG